jgi:hypothetical protein
MLSGPYSAAILLPEGLQLKTFLSVMLSLETLWWCGAILKVLAAIRCAVYRWSDCKMLVLALFVHSFVLLMIALVTFCCVGPDSLFDKNGCKNYCQ